MPLLGDDEKGLVATARSRQWGLTCARLSALEGQIVRQLPLFISADQSIGPNFWNPLPP
jgi:hypothetical protein